VNFHYKKRVKVGRMEAFTHSFIHPNQATPASHIITLIGLFIEGAGGGGGDYFTPHRGVAMHEIPLVSG